MERMGDPLQMLEGLGVYMQDDGNQSPAKDMELWRAG